jgi:hypothetical protein
VLNQRVVVKSRNVGNGRKRNVLQNDTKDILHTRENDHDVQFYNQRNNGAIEADQESWHNIVELLVVVNRVFHHLDSVSNVLLDVNMHHHGSNESSGHHIQRGSWGHQESCADCGVVPNANNHDYLYHLHDK